MKRKWMDRVRKRWSKDKEDGEEMYTDLIICATFIRFWRGNVNACQRRSPSASAAIKDPEYFRRVSGRTANQACSCDLPKPPHKLAFTLRVF